MSDSATSANICPQCEAPVATRAPEGLCPRCVAALNLYADTATTGVAEVQAQPAPTPEEIAAHFPQLEVIEFLGRGGMGVVYKARQKALGRLVALKLLAPERVADPKFADRFAHEGKALAALSHPNVVTIYDFGQAGGFFYLLMEFVDGVNLRQAMKAGRFTPEQALAIVPPVCEALQYAHEHGIVHRDIKPENLLLDKKGRVKIADFGVAKMLGEATTSVGVAESQPAGTPQYMAPEQKEHRATDHRADIYSLGMVLYEMLTGELPADKLQAPSKRVQVDVRIDEIVLRALEVKPEMRFATAAEFRTQVEAIAGSESARPTGAKELRNQTAGAAAARHPIATTVLGILLLALAVAVPTAGMKLHNRSIAFLSAKRQASIVSLQREFMDVNGRIGNANANAGRATARAGNGAFPEDIRVAAREEQKLHELEAQRAKEDRAHVNEKLAAAAAAQVDAKPWRAVLILLTILPFAITGVGLLVPSGRAKAPAITGVVLLAGGLVIFAPRVGLIEKIPNSVASQAAELERYRVLVAAEADTKFLQAEPQSTAAVKGHLLDQDGKPLAKRILAFVKAGRPHNVAGPGFITDGPTENDGTFQFELPTDWPWQAVLLQDGKEVARSAPMSTRTPASKTSDAPNYDLKLRLNGTLLEASLTPLSVMPKELERDRLLQALRRAIEVKEHPDSELQTRIASYERAFRLQSDALKLWPDKPDSYGQPGETGSKLAPAGNRRKQAKVTGRLEDQHGKPLVESILAVVDATAPNKDPLPPLPTDRPLLTHEEIAHDGTFQFSLPTGRLCQVILLQDGKQVARSVPIGIPARASETSDAPNYDLKLRLNGTLLEATLTPLSAAPEPTDDPVRLPQPVQPPPNGPAPPVAPPQNGASDKQAKADSIRQDAVVTITVRLENLPVKDANAALQQRFNQSPGGFKCGILDQTNSVFISAADATVKDAVEFLRLLDAPPAADAKAQPTDPLKQAEVRLTTATKSLESLETLHADGYITETELSSAKQRKLEAEIELERVRRL